MPSYNFFIKYAEENQKGFCWLLLLPPLLSPNTHTTPTHTHTQKHTHAHLHPLLKIGTEILSTLEEVPSGTISTWQAKPWDCARSSSQVLRRGCTAGDRFMPFCCQGSIHSLPWNLSLALHCSWLLCITVQTPQLGSPFHRGWSYMVIEKEQRCPCKDAVPK